MIEKPSPNEKVAVGLIHHPMLNKTGNIVTTSVTTLDVHDMARLSLTYGILSIYIVTPLKTQQRLIARMTRHWTEGHGGEHNPHRKRALAHVKVVDTIDDMIDNFSLGKQGVTLVSTGAKSDGNCVSYAKARQLLDSAGRSIVMFGTGHGMAPEAMEKADIRLAPIEGAGDFNHLPVRCAAAIIIDRLFGRE